MVNVPFLFARAPRIVFGAGALKELANLLDAFGDSVLLVTGRGSLRDSGRLDDIENALKNRGIRSHHLCVEGEPSPDLVDEAVKRFGSTRIDAVAAIGGGSVVDAGKAVSAMLPLKRSVYDFLEGVGTGEAHEGCKVPLLAAPTTAGTGSEATKNAVLSRVGQEGFKKSLRHDNFVPDVALVDPELALSSPFPVTAACGMDAFTQLLESFVSTHASPMTDALALSGIEQIVKNLLRACSKGAGDTGVRGAMAYGALLSGITLANAGLGVVHGLASPMGGAFPIPHGVVCGTLVGEATSATIDKLASSHGPDHPALRKYARVGVLMTGARDDTSGLKMLVETLDAWTEELKIPRLGEYGVRESDLDGIAAKAGCKYNPAPLDPEEIKKVLLKRL